MSILKITIFVIATSLLCPIAYGETNTAESAGSGEGNATEEVDATKKKKKKKKKKGNKKKKKKKKGNKATEEDVVAEQDEKDKTKSNKQRKKASSPAGAVTDFFAGEHDTKRFSTGLIGGLVINEQIGVGFEFAMVHSENLQYGLLILSGSADLKGHVSSSDTAEVKSMKTDGQILLGQGRYFFTKSFYSSFGFGMRSVTSDYVIGSSASSGTLEGNVTSTSMIINLVAGNRWTWDSGLYFGADWIGLTYPIASSYSSTTSTTGTVSSDIGEIQGKADDYGESLGQSMTFQLLLFNVGYIF